MVALVRGQRPARVIVGSCVWYKDCKMHALPSSQCHFFTFVGGKQKKVYFCYYTVILYTPIQNTITPASPYSCHICYPLSLLTILYSMFLRLHSIYLPFLCGFCLLGQHGGPVFSTVTSQKEGPGFGPPVEEPVWCS